MVKHVFTILDYVLGVDTQVGERIEIVIPGTDIIVPDELATDIITAINTATNAAVESINNIQAAAISTIQLNTVPTYNITINASNPIGNGSISFFLADVAVLRSIEATGITITSLFVNNFPVTLPVTLIGTSNVIINGLITEANQVITLTLSPLPANRSIRVGSPNITQYATYPIASGVWVPSLGRILFLGYTSSNYGYIFDHNNSYISTNLFNISFYFTPLVHVPYNNCIYIINGSSIVPYYITTNTYGSAITLSGTIYAQAFNPDDNVLYVGTSAGLYAINVITNQLIYWNTTYPLCTYITYLNVAGNKLLVVCRHTATADNHIIINVAT